MATNKKITALYERLSRDDEMVDNMLCQPVCKNED